MPGFRAAALAAAMLLRAAASAAEPSQVAAEAYQMGLAREKAGDYRGAAGYYDTALMAQRNHPQALNRLAACQYRLGEKAKALESYKAYLELRPGDAATAAFAAKLEQQLKSGAAPPSPGPPKFKPRFGFKGSLGYGMALSAGGFGYGNQTDELGCSGCYYNYLGVGLDADNDPYPAYPGQGFAFGFEALAMIHPNLELGLGVYPLGLDARASSSGTATGVAIENSSSAQFMAMPFMAMAYARLPTPRPELFFVAGAGIGLAPGGNLVARSETRYSGGSNYTKSDVLTKSMDMAMAGRAAFGAEWEFNRHLALSAGVAYTAAAFSSSQDAVETEYKFNSSTNVYKYSRTMRYVASPPARGSEVHTGPTTSGFTTTETWEDGRSKRTETSTWDPATGGWTYHTRIDSQEPKGQGEDGLFVSQFSPYLSVTYRF